jgi:hypothetical protein
MKKQYLILKFFSGNAISDEGLAKIVEGVSNLLNLTNLNLNFE